jgi:hypothetical protein
MDKDLVSHNVKKNVLSTLPSSLRTLAEVVPILRVLLQQVKA